MRLKAGIWVSAYLRRCAGEGLPVYVARRGDEDAGAILIKVDYLNGETMVYGPAPGMSFASDGERRWARLTGAETVDDERADQAIARQANFDPDIWVLVVEDRTGAALLDASMIAEM